MRLIVVTQDRLSDWEKKGEVVKGYFNPNNTFDSVDVVLLNNDLPPQDIVRYLCGEATYRLYNLPLLTYGIMLKTVGWQPLFLRGQYKWLIDALDNGEPTVVRAYETSLSSYSAYIISMGLGCKYALSLHSTPDNYALQSYASLKDKIVRNLTSRLGRIGMVHASKIMAVYRSIIQALPIEIREKSIVVPNAVGVNFGDFKKSYSSRGPLKLVTTGRLVKGKSPAKIIAAISKPEKTELTVIGDGPLYDELLLQSDTLTKHGRIKFIKRMDNAELCSELQKYDVFLFRTDYNECPKTVIEAALVGLPIICPKSIQQRVSELQDFPLITCDDTAEGFANALDRLKNKVERKKIGRDTANKAYKRWAPESCASKSANLLISLIN